MIYHGEKGERMNLFEWYREYAILIVSLFLIGWSAWKLIKDKKNGKPIAKKSIIAGIIGVVIIIVVSFLILK